jgi:hypothetical protein
MVASSMMGLCSFGILLGSGYISAVTGSFSWFLGFCQSWHFCDVMVFGIMQGLSDFD